jgi:hypothetical protein
MPGDSVRVPQRAAAHGRGSAVSLGTVAVLLLLVLIGLVPLSSAQSVGAAGAVRSPAVHLGTEATHPASSTPACYAINSSICITMANASAPDIIPAPGSHSSSVMPEANSSINLYILSRYDLIWPTAHYSGPLSPISLNATGVLWNGVPYYSANDSTIWHPPGALWWSYGPLGQNKTYPWTYEVNFSAHALNGAPDFFPGMTISWWLYLTSNVSGVLSHNSSDVFSFTYAGAWPASPYAGAPNYAGAAAALEDLNVSRRPLTPNFNDTVQVNVSTTSLDVRTGASIGGGYIDASEYAPSGVLLHQTTFTLPVTVAGGLGASATNVTIPTAWSQVAGALVEYRVTAWDTNTYGPDQVETPVYSYTVHGNGTFLTGVFATDLSVVASPSDALLGGSPPPVIAAGTPVAVTLTSQNPGSAILSAEVIYTFNYTTLGETVTSTVALTRVSSIDFVGTIPAMPLNATVTFAFRAWDFQEAQETSKTYSYTTPTFANLVPRIPSNSTFFLVYVYDEARSAWISGATVTIQAVSGYVHVNTTTFLGVAYPNATGLEFQPLLLPAGASYRVTVSTPSFDVPFTVVAPHTFTTNGILAVGSGWQVAESGPAFYVTLNETAASVPYAQPGSVLGNSPWVGATLGLVAIGVTGVPLVLWFAAIQRRRRQEEKRITL